MQFKNLEDKCTYYRSLTDYRFLPNSYVIAMLDGRSFSKNVKNKFEKPFDNDFVNAMNETAKYLCENVQGVKAAYVQSDEISLLIKDSSESDVFFGGRLCKMQSIMAALASTKFTQIMTHNALKKVPCSKNDAIDMVLDMPLYEFDCKVWTVPNANDAFAWFLWRQIDCIRNSKQQAAQTYCSYKELLRLDTDKQIAFLKEKTGIDWYTAYNDGVKYGRIIVQQPETITKDVTIKGVKQTITFDRNGWQTTYGFPLTEDGNKEKFYSLVGME